MLRNEFIFIFSEINWTSRGVGCLFSHSYCVVVWSAELICNRMHVNWKLVRKDLFSSRHHLFAATQLTGGNGNHHNMCLLSSLTPVMSSATVCYEVSFTGQKTSPRVVPEPQEACALEKSVIRQRCKAVSHSLSSSIADPQPINSLNKSE